MTILGGVKTGFGCFFGVLAAIVLLFVILAIIVGALGGGADDEGEMQIQSSPATTSVATQAAEQQNQATAREQQGQIVQLHAPQRQAQAEPQVGPPFTPYENEEGEQTSEGTVFKTSRDPINDALTSFVAVRHTLAGEFDFEPALLIVGCFEGSFQVLVTGMPFTFLESELDMEYRFDKGEAVAVKWEVVDDDSLSTTASPLDDRAFEEGMREAASLAIRGRSNTDDTETFEFSLGGLWDTPVQANLDLCGEY